MSSQILNEQGNPITAHVALETTASEARAEAPTAKVAEQVEKNADRTHAAAEHAAKVAKVKGPELTGEPISAVEQLQAGASDVTTNAVVEGERDVENVKAAGTSYLEQAKVLASFAIATAQSYLPERLGGQTTSPGISPHTKPDSSKTVADSISSTLQSGIDSALETAKQYAVAAQETIQSQVESKGAADTTKQYIGTTQETVKTQVERAKGAAQGLMGTTGTQGAQLPDDIDNSAGVPATSVPLESGQDVVNTTYPSTGAATKIAAWAP